MVNKCRWCDKCDMNGLCWYQRSDKVQWCNDCSAIDLKEYYGTKEAHDE